MPANGHTTAASGAEDPAARTKAAELERYLEETRTLRIANDLRQERGEIENEGLRREQVTTDRGRYILMSLMAFGSIAGILVTIIEKQ